MRQRIFLVTPTDGDPERLAERVGAALSGGDVASVLIDPTPWPPIRRADLTKAVASVCNTHDVAAIVLNDTQLAGRAGADGVHIDKGMEDLDLALDSFQGRKIVGAGRITSRHEALIVGERDVDYVFFGRVDRPEIADGDPAALALAEWWAPIVEIPCVAMAGQTADSVEAACDTGAEFIGLRAHIWNNHDGPADAIRRVNDCLQ